jgi:hypothetical protein
MCPGRGKQKKKPTPNVKRGSKPKSETKQGRSDKVIVYLELK